MENKKIKENTKYIQDISPIEGIYSDFILLKPPASKLVAMIEVQGINLDLLSEYELNKLFEEYGAFLMANSQYNLETVSMMVPLDFKRYNLSWKKRYLCEKDNNGVNKHLKELIASYCLHYQNLEFNSELATQKHLMILSVDIERRTLAKLTEAEKILKENLRKIKNSLNIMMENYDTTIEILNTKETILTLYRFIDFKNSMYS